MKAINEAVNKASYDYPYIGIGTNFENSPLHFHSEIEILHVMEGEIFVSVESERKMLKKGDICIILPRQIHTLFEMRQIRLSVIKLFSALPLYGTRMESYIFDKDSPHYSALHREIKRLLSEDAEKNIGYQLAVRSACDSLTLYILRNLLPTNDPKQSPERQMAMISFFENANEYIEENYKKEITLDTAAAAFGYSRSYFSRLFKAVCGMNFSDYLSVFRLKKSTVLLQNSDLTIEGVALACGYNCLRSYNRAFQKHFGQSPGGYRRRFSKTTEGFRFSEGQKPPCNTQGFEDSR